MKRCMYCGNVNDDNAEICSKCGNRLMDMPAESLDQEPVDTAPADPGMPAPQDDQVPEIAPPEESVPFAEGVKEDAATAQALSDVQRGQTYGAQQQYNGVPENLAYGGQDYSYSPAADAQQQYGGQAYGYDHPQPYFQPGEEGDVPGPDQGRGRIGEKAAALQRKARKRVKSFLWLLISLAFTALMAGSIFNVVTGNAIENFKTGANTIMKALGSGMARSTISLCVNYVMGLRPLLVKLVLLGLHIPGVFIFLGLWTAFFATSAKKEEVSTSGLTMLRVIEIIKFILACAVLLAAIIFSVAYVVIAGAGSSTMTLLFGIIMLLIVVIVTVFVIMYFIQLIFSLKLVRANVRDGSDIGRIPGFLIFMGFVRCLIAVATMLPLDPNAYDGLGIAGYDIGFLTQGMVAVWLLLVTLWALIYRLVVKRSKE